MPGERMAKCETRRDDGSQCWTVGTFLVGVGQRKSDRQLACSRHLAATVIAMDGSEMRPTPQITVTWHPFGVPAQTREKTDGGS